MGSVLKSNIKSVFHDILLRAGWPGFVLTSTASLALGGNVHGESISRNNSNPIANGDAANTLTEDLSLFFLSLFSLVYVLA